MSGAAAPAIRAARPVDAASIAELSRTLAAHVADPDPGADTTLIAEACFGPERWMEVIVADQEGDVLGLAAYCRRFELHTRERSLWLADLVVAERARGRGVGRLLMRELARRAEDLACAAIVLDLWAGNAGARGFYDRIGARPKDGIEIRVIDTRRR